MNKVHASVYMNTNLCFCAVMFPLHFEPLPCQAAPRMNEHLCFEDMWVLFNLGGHSQMCVAALCLETGQRVKTVNHDIVEDVLLHNPAERWMMPSYAGPY